MRDEALQCRQQPVAATAPDSEILRHVLDRRCALSLHDRAMESRSRRLRELARHYRGLADAGWDPDETRRLIGMARSYERRAAEEEARSRELDSAEET